VLPLQLAAPFKPVLVPAQETRLVPVQVVNRSERELRRRTDRLFFRDGRGALRSAPLEDRVVGPGETATFRVRVDGWRWPPGRCVLEARHGDRGVVIRVQLLVR
jgi:hypothetical protein